jgi:hypothetical protein
MSNSKVNCTCGWSWNKSDSSKKDMYICHECGKDNSNNMKNGGWLDNYNDSEISAPEGYVGEGTSNKGRNYSPAWGGQFKNGGITKDDNGYWNPDNWGKPVEIGSNDITMEGVDQDLIGISDEGDVQYMTPGNNYKFKGKKVTEFPVSKEGSELKKLDQLTNFSNYNTKQSGGWLDKFN